MQSNFKGRQRMRRHGFAACQRLRACSAILLTTAARFFVLASALLASAMPARAVITRPLDFTGTEQVFDATIDLTGNLFANGSGSVVNTKAKVEPFLFKAPISHVLTLFGGAIKLSSDPQTDPFGSTVDYVGHQLIDIDDLDLDLLNGQTTDFWLSSIFITTNSTVSLLKSLSIDVSGTLTGLRFDQTGAATVLGGPHSGTFLVDGEFTANVDNLLAVVFGLLQFPIDNQFVVLPSALQGSWTISGPPNNSKIALEGNLHLDIPISLLTNLTTAITDVLSLTISSTVDLAASLTVDFQYHLENLPIMAPEPGSIVLLGIGLAAVGGVAVQRMRGREKR